MDPVQLNQMLQFYPTDILSQAMRMKASGLGQGLQAGPQAGFNFGQDGLALSEGFYDRGGQSYMPQFGGVPNAGQRLGSNGGYGGVPGFGGFGGPGQFGNPQQMQQQMMMMMMMLMMMMQMMQRMGAGQQQPQRPTGQQGQQQPQQGGTIELQKGQSFTTPGGCNIDWKKNTVKITEPGGGQRDLADGFASAQAGVDQRGNAWAKAMAWGNGQEAAAAAAGPYGSAAASAVAGKAKYANKGRSWKVWGDPHIQNPDGSKQDFKTKNAVFTLQDGTKVLMMADKPDGNVNRVQVTLPGGQMNLQGVDQKQTTVYANDGNKLNSMGTLDKYTQAFPNAGLGVSPSGNQLFP